MSSNTDKECICMECGLDFEIKDSEQTFYVQRGLALPKRCAPCRAERKAFKDNPSPPEQVTNEVECHHCDRLTVVPFTPHPGSDVYCRVCWEGIKNVGITGAVYV